MTVKFRGDVDIDMADRQQLLQLIPHTAASMWVDGVRRRHNSGIYPMPTPYDPVTDMCAIDYEQAEARGYTKIDLLNIWLYRWVKSEEHLQQLMAQPDWSMLRDPQFVSKLLHIGNHYYNLQKMPQPVDSIPRLAMFLAIIRPGKKHLIGQPWSEVAKTVWDKEGGGYTFKKSHAIAYAHLLVVHMNLLSRGEIQQDGSGHALDKGD